MSWRMIKEHSGSAETSDFKRAISMMKEGLEMICDLSEEMEDRYSDRHYRSDETRRYDERYR